MSKTKVRIVLNRSGVKELLKSDAIMQVCKDYAYSAQASLGDGYEVSYRAGKNRANAQIKAVSRKAKLQNLRNNSILKALGK